MGQFDEVVERLTDRLRIDPELRMDISHELKTHLEDVRTNFVRRAMMKRKRQRLRLKRSAMRRNFRNNFGWRIEGAFACGR